MMTRLKLVVHNRQRPPQPSAATHLWLMGVSVCYHWWAMTLQNQVLVLQFYHSVWFGIEDDDDPPPDGGIPVAILTGLPPGHTCFQIEEKC